MFHETPIFFISRRILRRDLPASLSVVNEYVNIIIYLEWNTILDILVLSTGGGIVIKDERDHGRRLSSDGKDNVI